MKTKASIIATHLPRLIKGFCGYFIPKACTAVFLAATWYSLPAPAQEVSGHWRYLRMEEQERGPDPGSYTLTGKRGDVTIGITESFHVTDVGQVGQSLSGRYRWDAPPTALVPGQVLMVPIKTNVLVNTHPNNHRSWGMGARVLWDGAYLEEERGGRAFKFVSVRVHKDTPVPDIITVITGEDTFKPKIIIPSGRKDQEATISVSIQRHNHSMEYQYIYAWTTGSPPPNGPATTGGSNAGVTPPPSTGGQGNEPATVTNMTLQIGTRRVTQGQAVTVPVWLLKANSVANMNFNVRYDPAVATASSGVKGNLLDRAIFEFNPAETGLARVGFAQNTSLAGDGTVAQISFQAKGAPGTRTPLTLEITTLSGTDGGSPAVALIHGEIVIVGPDGQIPGDSDGDGRVTARDAGDALKMSVRLIPVKLICDLDADGQVTSTDARLILAKAAGK